MKYTYLFLVVVGLLAAGAACQKNETVNTNTVRNTAVVNNATTTGSFTTNNSTNTTANTNTRPANSNSTTSNTNQATNSNTNSTSSSLGIAALPIAQRVSDSTSTLSNPTKVKTYDGKQYFIVGQPKGQNSKATKKIIFSLPGHGSTAEQDYAAWKSQITSHDYALASVNWWDGSGETPTDYYSPAQVLGQINAYLAQQGYDAEDFVVLEGFSRGSANTYAVKSYDMMAPSPSIDAVISASGKYQSDFPLAPGAVNQSNLYASVPWVLACGVKDDNPTRDGCTGMSETKTWLLSKGANVLKQLEDPNGAHGAFHQSPLKLADQALDLLDDWLQDR